MDKMKITELKPHPKNEEIYGYDEDITDLVDRIRQSGQVHTLVVNHDGYILAGHRRRRACMELGIKEVDVEVRKFDYPEEEVEFIINDNHYREKTVEQKAREAKALKEAESEKARRRQATSTGGTRPQLVAKLPQAETQIEQGKSRDIVAKKVGLKSGREVDRAIRAVETIDKLKEKGRTDDAELIKGVLNNRSASAADELAKNIDKIQIPDKEKPLIKQGKKSPNKYIEQIKIPSKTKVCKICGLELSVENFYSGKGECAVCFNQKRKSKFYDASGNELKTDPEVIKNLVIPIDEAVASMKTEPTGKRETDYAMEFEIFRENLEDYLFVNGKFTEGSIFKDMPSDYIEMFQQEVTRLSQFISVLQRNLKS